MNYKSTIFLLYSKIGKDNHVKPNYIIFSSVNAAKEGPNTKSDFNMILLSSMVLY